jgi:hypothetical protein
MHTELGGYLTSALRYRSSAPEVYIQNYLGSEEIVKQSMSSIWEIQNIGSIYMGDKVEMEERKLQQEDL